MTDRVPGAPGQYTMTVSASEAQKILTGEAVSVTLVRDDQPLVEGTPYNKQAVLPDDLAARICPNVIDPTPADAMDGLSKKKYPATLLSAGWTSTGGMYTQMILNNAIVGDDNESVKSWPKYTGTKSTDEAIRDACAAVTYAKTSAGAITFYCLEDKPEVDIPIMVEVSR